MVQVMEHKVPEDNISTQSNQDFCFISVQGYSLEKNFKAMNHP